MKRIVSAVEDGVPQAEAARLFGVAGPSLLRTDLEVRPFATLQQRREMLSGSLGVNVCLSTVYEQRNPQRRVKPKTTV